MTTTPQTPPQSANRLLAALPAASYAALVPGLETVTLSRGQLLYEADAPIRHVYFPCTAVVSLLTPMEGGLAVESLLVGNDGVVGLPVYLGLTTDTTRAHVEVPGAAQRMGAEAFHTAVERDKTLLELLQRYTQVVLAQLGQSSACNRQHSGPERCARWLLETQDRAGLATLPLTQAVLANLLGVRRTAVLLAVGPLQQAGYLRYQRGQVTVLDRAGLEGTTCSCYWAVRHITDQLLGPNAV